MGELLKSPQTRLRRIETFQYFREVEKMKIWEFPEELPKGFCRILAAPGWFPV